MLSATAQTRCHATAGRICRPVRSPFFGKSPAICVPKPVNLALSKRQNTGLVVHASRRDIESPALQPAKATVEGKDKAVSEWFGKAAKTAAMVGIAAALFLMPVGAADAARSGGRVGGSNFGAARSYSPPASRSYSAPSRGYSSYGSTYVAPSVGFSSFFFPVSPWGFGGYGYGPTVVAPAPMGGGMFSLVIEILIVVALIAAVTSFFSNSSEADEYDTMGGNERVAVAKLQVGLLGSARGLQRDLDRMASRADTSTSEGLFYILQETVLALNRNPDYWVYGGSNIQYERGYDNAESAFNELSLNERSKFRQETLSNIDGRSTSSSYNKGAKDGDSELIVVTILVAADVNLNLPKINSTADLRTALNRVGSVPEQSIVAVEVLWTPQDPNDYYTKDEVIADYPELAVL